MSKACNICGGLIMAPGEIMGYGGPICNGLHGTTSGNDLRSYDPEAKKRS